MVRDKATNEKLEVPIDEEGGYLSTNQREAIIALRYYRKIEKGRNAKRNRLEHLFTLIPLKISAIRTSTSELVKLLLNLDTPKGSVKDIVEQYGWKDSSFPPTFDERNRIQMIGNIRQQKWPRETDELLKEMGSSTEVLIWDLLSLTSHDNREEIITVVAQFRRSKMGGKSLSEITDYQKVILGNDLYNMKCLPKEEEDFSDIPRVAGIHQRGIYWKEFETRQKGDNDKLNEFLKKNVAELDVNGLINLPQFISSLKDSFKSKHSGKDMVGQMKDLLNDFPSLLRLPEAFAIEKGGRKGWIYEDFLDQNETYGCIYNLMMKILYRHYLKDINFEEIHNEGCQRRSILPGLARAVKFLNGAEDIHIIAEKEEIDTKLDVYNSFKFEEFFSGHYLELEQTILEDCLLLFHFVFKSIQEHLWSPAIKKIYIEKKDGIEIHTKSLEEKMRSIGLDWEKLKQSKWFTVDAAKSKEIVKKMKRWRGLYLLHHTHYIAGGENKDLILNRLKMVVEDKKVVGPSLGTFSMIEPFNYGGAIEVLQKEQIGGSDVLSDTLARLELNKGEHSPSNDAGRTFKNTNNGGFERGAGRGYSKRGHKGQRGNDARRDYLNSNNTEKGSSHNSYADRRGDHGNNDRYDSDQRENSSRNGNRYVPPSQRR